MTDRFERYCSRKVEAALAAEIPGFDHVRETSAAAKLDRIGSDWTGALFGGWFYHSPNPESPHHRGLTPDATDHRGQTPEPPTPELPRINLVFVQSRDGDTDAPEPSALGGGETDKHLVYEGLSRVDADAVMAGATTARADDLVFSVWHPELVRLREERGHPRHPVQIVVTDRADLPLDTALLYTTPSLRTMVVTGPAGAARLRARVADRPWIEVVDAGQPFSFEHACRDLSRRGIRRISAIGGRQTATGLLRAGLVSDLYLTTSPISAGRPHTPFYEGTIDTALVVEKRGRGSEEGVRFEHFVIERQAFEDR